MPENHKNELRKLADEFYDSYVNVTPVIERFKALWPMYYGLGIGFSYVGMKFPHSFSDGDIVLFWIPFLFGLLLYVYSCGRAFYAMFWLNDQNILGDPETYNETFKRLSNLSESKQEIGLEHILDHLADRKMSAASQAINLLNRRSRLIHNSAQIVIVAFALLVASIPRLISTYNYWH